MNVPPTTVMFGIITGASESRAIKAAVELGVPEVLQNGPLSITELAGKLSCNEEALFRLMRALGAVSVFTQDPEGRWRSTPLSETLLPSTPGSLKTAALEISPSTSGTPRGDLAESVRTGRPSFEAVHGMSFFDWLASHPNEASQFSSGMSRSSRLQANAILDAYDFAPYSTIADIGGGEGALLAAILDRHGNTQGILYDLPHVVRCLPSCNRMKVVSGNFLEDALPRADGVMLKAVLHDWSDEVASRILSACRRALASQKGRVLVVEMILPDDNRPHPARMMDMNLLTITDGGRERTASEYERLAIISGFHLLRSYPTSTPLVVMELGVTPHR